MRKLLFLFITFFASQTLASGIDSHVPRAKIVGEARMSVLIWDAYDATLFAPNGAFDRSKPFALKLTYLRDFEGADIAERSVKEMRHVGMKDETTLAAWLKEMEAIFPDVAEGDAITGIYQPQKPTHFYQSNTRIGTIKDLTFGQWFFDIWLSENTSEPELRTKLLGLN